jgi:peptide/nickel transport system substrate-binding protein
MTSFTTLFRKSVFCGFVLALGLSVAAISARAEVPFLQDKVQSGKLPPVAERLPQEPLKIDFAAEGKVIGKYGGDLRMLMGKIKDLGQITVYTYARLVGYGPDFNFYADIAESYEVKEGREFTFKLRKGHKWSDGHPVTSEDFRYFWEDMVNNEELGREGVPSQMLVDGEPPVFKVIDEQTFSYTWKKNNPAFLPAIAAPSPLYLYRPAHYMKQFHAKYADADKLKRMVEEENVKDWAALHTRKQRQRRPENPELPSLQAWMNTTPPPSTRFVFVRNPFFHRIDPEGNQLPYIDRLVMHVVSKDVIAAKTGSGEADLQARYLRFDDLPFLKSGEETNDFTTHLWLNGKGSQVALFPNLNVNDPVWRKLTRDVRFRRALSLAIDREEINEAIYFGLATPSANTVLPRSPLYREEFAKMWAERDIDLANKLLDETGLDKKDSYGFRLLPDGRPAEITLETAGESSEETDVLELIIDHMKDIGIKLYVRSSQRDIFRRRAYAGDTIISVAQGLNNGISSAEMDPEELAPTDQAQLQWPSWGQYYGTKQKAGEPADLDEAKAQLELYESWMAATSLEEKEQIWLEMLKNYADQVFTIGTVNNSRQPVVVSNKLQNVPEEGIYSWEPTSYFGNYKPDTFWYDK